MPDSVFKKMEAMIRSRQQEIAKTLGELDGKKFTMDEWFREDGSGGGVSAVIEDGNVIERGACNVSVVSGHLTEAGYKKMRENHGDLQWNGNPIPYRVCGLSMIMHPHNPHAPTVHLNYRYFECDRPDGQPMSCWFGGGADLTPSYLYDDDAVYFHQVLKAVCDKHNQSYGEMKEWCDQYFRNHHRNEGRGIGGIFYDDLTTDKPMEVVDFATDALDSFLKVYVPILKERKDLPYTKEEKAWQAFRRGRYVEFNLLHDRGTAFGLMTPGARVESILCSMPRFAEWKYQYKPEPGSREAALVEVLETPINWADKKQSTYPLPPI
ncbi:coproporphyrinogen oxidase [Starmerella bacillaris]|mgnify:CR=1 FL=1|uniref:coproporphyrinogen oxidase n=1 Tax=Starmerella bacillaris TaxID=1247836 RepID=A0AAV5REC5_STABA|nr:coproporphyrinogen oxidase [Starmerella bacillaris]